MCFQNITLHFAIVALSVICQRGKTISIYPEHMLKPEVTKKRHLHGKKCRNYWMPEGEKKCMIIFSLLLQTPDGCLN